ncbi:MAG: biopolymer transporter ExbD [Bacteroides sp.]|nr:biopolymer transporter ExbD [Prevotella sp.]MCM1408537.1 biopolymer transporter ExbD [Treponema brennaborense]MCM1470749.1 biopolymer transporter ExbD [Bacteroides sp.]
MKRLRRAAARAQVDLIPMIDVVFQLILFFLVSTTFALLPAISVKLPESETAENAEIRSITVTARSDGTLYFNAETVSMEQLSAKLAAADVPFAERKDFPVQFEADELVTNGVIVRVFDVLRENGFAAIQLRTESRSAQTTRQKTGNGR